MRSTSKVLVVNKSNNPLPSYSTKGSSAMDICAFFEDKLPVFVNPQDRVVIPTGIFVQVPEGKEFQVRPRSGLAAKNGITVLNTPGTIDSDYRGEIKVILHNTSNQPFRVDSGDRIAQIALCDVTICEFRTLESVEEFDDTERGEGGFGHTGVS